MLDGMLTLADFQTRLGRPSDGAGAIAYKMITGSNTKGAAAGILAVILVFAKKLWLLLLLPVVFVWKGIKRLFTGKEEA